MDAFRAALRQELPHSSAAMGRQSIPNDQEFAGDMVEQMLEKTHDGRTFESLLLRHQVQVTSRRNGADGREMIPGQRDAQQRRFAYRRIGAYQGGQQIEARFIHKHYGASFLRGFFCRSGQVSLRQRSTASSSRCSARSTGFWLLQRTAFKRRPTCVRLYRTPNSRSITLATRRRVHTSPRKPKCSAPCFNRLGSRPNCSSLKRRGAPLFGWVRSASTPPSRPRRIQSLTAALLTPKASAIAFWLQPFSFGSHACRRRASRKSCGFLARCLSMPPVYHLWLPLFSFLWSAQ